MIPSCNRSTIPTFALAAAVSLAGSPALAQPVEAQRTRQAAGAQSTQAAQPTVQTSLQNASETRREFYEVLTLASIVEWEARVPGERARIAGVYLNRLLGRPATGRMRLQAFARGFAEGLRLPIDPETCRYRLPPLDPEARP